MRLIDADALLEKECCGRISGNDVRNAPTIDAEPVRHGCEWCNGEYHTELSAHAVRYHTSDKSSVYVLNVNFCPNCGAKIRGDEDAVK